MVSAKAWTSLVMAFAPYPPSCAARRPSGERAARRVMRPPELTRIHLEADAKLAAVMHPADDLPSLPPHSHRTKRGENLPLVAPSATKRFARRGTDDGEEVNAHGCHARRGRLHSTLRNGLGLHHRFSPLQHAAPTRQKAAQV